MSHEPEPSIGPVNRFGLFQRGADLQFLRIQEASQNTYSTSEVDQGSFLAQICSKNLEFYVTGSSYQRQSRKKASEFWESGSAPNWAENWGNDDIGGWVSFRVNDVVQMMRWIPAGEFLMGSPEDEEGRWSKRGRSTA